MLFAKSSVVNASWMFVSINGVFCLHIFAGSQIPIQTASPQWPDNPCRHNYEINFHPCSEQCGTRSSDMIQGFRLLDVHCASDCETISSADRPRDLWCLSILDSAVRYLERRLLLLVTSASDLPLRAIKFCSVLFVHAVINKNSLMRRRLCDKLHGPPSQLLLARPAVIDQ